jgi:hypothetical protein
VHAQEQHPPITRKSKQRAKQDGSSDGPAAAGMGTKGKYLAPEQADPPGGALSAEAEAPAAPPVARSQGRVGKHAERHNGAAHAAAGPGICGRAASRAAPAEQQEHTPEAATRQDADWGRLQQQQWLAGATHTALADESSSSSEDERQEEPRAWPAGSPTGKVDAAHDEPKPSGSEEAGAPRWGMCPIWCSDQHQAPHHGPCLHCGMAQEGVPGAAAVVLR